MGRVVVVRRARLDSIAEQDEPTFTLAEVSKHNRSDDAWIVVKGKIYDITEFIGTRWNSDYGDSVGTIQAILPKVGTDCTDYFIETQTKRVWRVLERYYIGDVAHFAVQKECASLEKRAKIEKRATIADRATTIPERVNVEGPSYSEETYDEPPIESPRISAETFDMPQVGIRGTPSGHSKHRSRSTRSRLLRAIRNAPRQTGALLLSALPVGVATGNK
mmetsp:Transcript_37433/g.81498  ORF Transcript_37433/g.81498 Transcript_37433/m.81498 type:complete len:219 (+) Transcript_37433:339-995(+)|eukprot:CAMPEP_0118922886 /NCGR_PEP_ID=MMETSP1169-20130426/1643_1 /TAXON_ID=36882 /ORGANISM="Pyramimonas obovata, Strain CCMP722" /LENGTH=218 /DNA_ID=CAMNT_0006863815 /DNA_START=336 /DNA_END=992 /DNA_ORIENTATION=+